MTWLKEAGMSSMQLKSSHTCMTLLITPLLLLDDGGGEGDAILCVSSSMWRRAGGISFSALSVRFTDEEFRHDMTREDEKEITNRK